MCASLAAELRVKDVIVECATKEEVVALDELWGKALSKRNLILHGRYNDPVCYFKSDKSGISFSCTHLRRWTEEEGYIATEFVGTFAEYLEHLSPACASLEAKDLDEFC